MWEELLDIYKGEKFQTNLVTANFSTMSSQDVTSEVKEEDQAEISEEIDQASSSQLNLEVEPPESETFINVGELSQPLNEVQLEKLLANANTPVLQAILNLLRKAKIPFAFAGSYAGYALGVVEEYNDIDLFINAESALNIPGFEAALRSADPTAGLDFAMQKHLPYEDLSLGWPLEFREKHGLTRQQFEELMCQRYHNNETEIRTGKQRDNPKRFKKNLDEDLYDAAHYDPKAPKKKREPPNPKRLKISDVTKLKPLIGLHIDLVFAPKLTIKNSEAYSLYVIRHFDLQQSRIAIFNRSFDLPDVFYSMSLMLPSWEDLQESRRKKYEGRTMTVTPSKLTLLTVNTMLTNKQIDFEDN